MNVVVISVEDLLKLVRTAIKEEIHPIPSQSKQSHEYLSIAEAAAYLRLPINTLYSYCHQNTIPYHKRGKRSYFLKSDLDAWMASNRQKSVKEIQNEVLVKKQKGGTR